jgi:hypothetical protein
MAEDAPITDRSLDAPSGISTSMIHEVGRCADKAAAPGPET